MHLAAALVAAALLAGCRLDPLVSDTPGASTNILPPGTVVPRAQDNGELVNQILLSAGLAQVRDKVIPRGIGQSAGTAIGFWALGPGSRAPSQLYEFVVPGGKVPHPPLVNALPGDRGYNPLHRLFRVEVSDDYQGQRITTLEALADAIDIGLISEPAQTGRFVALGVVLPDMLIQVDPTTTVPPEQTIYGRGHELAAFRFGGDLGVQPTGPLLPTLQVSFLREPGQGSYDASRPIFQATIPPAPPAGSTANYTALSTVILVDLAQRGDAADIAGDGDLFMRGAGGEIIGARDVVQRFEVTATTLVLPLQLPGGMP